MPPNREASKARFYQYRLMQVLLAKDIAELAIKYDCLDLDLIDRRYWLLDNWKLIEKDILEMITNRVSNA